MTYPQRPIPGGSGSGPGGIAPPPGTPGGPGGGSPTAPAQTRRQAAQQALNLPTGIIPIYFGVTSVASGGDASGFPLFRSIPGGAGTGAAQLPLVPPFRGSVVAMTFFATAVKTAGFAEFSMYVNGVQLPGRVVWESNTDSGYETFQPGNNPFEPGDELSARITIQSFTPVLSVELVAYLTQASSI